MKKIIVGISGASGAILAERFVRFLLQAGHQVHAIVSPSGAVVFEEELGVALGSDQSQILKNFHSHFGGHENLLVAPADDFADRVSSGSAKIDAMVVIPCSMSTVGAIAHGLTMNLIHRAAGVSIKEKRPLVLVPRESPLSPIHLKNLLYLSEIGVHIAPATTAFYHHPKTIEEMADFTVGRVLDLLKIEHALFKRWKQPEECNGVYQGI
jgi:4-hydroxy-3-polyprenylbenzoate decarboxylase